MQSPQNTPASLQLPCSADSSRNSHWFFSHSDGGLSHEPENSHSLSEFSGLSERSPLVVQTHANPRVTASPTPLLHDLQQSDSTSYVLLNLAKGKEIESHGSSVLSSCVTGLLTQYDK